MKKLFFSALLAFLCSGVSAQLISTGLLDVMKERGESDYGWNMNSISLYDDTLFASTMYGIYYKDLKSDGHWSPLGNISLAVDDLVKNGDHIVAVARLSEDASEIKRRDAAQALILSDDNGKTYEVDSLKEFSEGFYSYRITSLTQNPSRKEQLFLISEILEDNRYRNLGLFISNDNGKRWLEVSKENGASIPPIGLYEDPSHVGCVGRVYMNPHDADMGFIVGMEAHWEGIKGALLRTNDCFAVVDKITELDGADVHDNAPQSILFNKENKNIMLMSVENGILKSTDGGNNWTFKLKVNGRKENEFFTNIVYDKDIPNVVYALSTAHPYVSFEKKIIFHIYVSDDDGETWNLACTINDHSVNYYYITRFGTWMHLNLLVPYTNKLFICCDDDVFYLDTTDIQTGISSVSTEDCIGDGFIYDLQGRRLSAEPAHGIYIKDGKKIAR